MKYLIAFILVSFLSPNIVFGDEHDKEIVRAIYINDIHKESNDETAIKMLQSAGFVSVKKRTLKDWLKRAKDAVLAYPWVAGLTTNDNDRFDKIDKGLEKINDKLDRQDQKFDRQDQKFDRQDKKIDRIDERSERNERRLDDLENK